MVREPSTRPKVETGEVDVSRNCVGSVWDMSRWRRTRLTCLPEQSSHYSRAAPRCRRDRAGAGEGQREACCTRLYSAAAVARAFGGGRGGDTTGSEERGERRSARGTRRSVTLCD